MVVRMLSQEFPMMPLGQRIAPTVAEEALGLQRWPPCVLGEAISWREHVLLWVSQVPIPTPFPLRSQSIL